MENVEAVLQEMKGKSRIEPEEILGDFWDKQLSQYCTGDREKQFVKEKLLEGNDLIKIGRSDVDREGHYDLSKWLARQTWLSPDAKLVFTFLDGYSPKGSAKAWPKQETIMKALGFSSIKQVQRAIKELLGTPETSYWQKKNPEKNRLLISHQEGSRRSNRYYLLYKLLSPKNVN